MEQEQMLNGDNGMGMKGGRDRKPESRDLSRPAFPRAAERAGITTSAMTRDATRLRTVMTRAAGDPATKSTISGAGPNQAVADHEVTDHEAVEPEIAREEGADHESVMYAPHGGEEHIEPAAEIPLPDLASAPVDQDLSHPAADDAVSQPEPDHNALEQAGFGATKIVMPKGRPTSLGYRSDRSNPVAEVSDSAGNATRLRPVATLAPVQGGEKGGQGNREASELYTWSAPPSPHREPVKSAEPQGTFAASYNDVWDAAATAATPKVASDSWHQTRQERHERRGGGFKRGAVSVAMVLVGTTIGLGLYVGGGDFLSEFFANKNEGVETLSPSAVTELPPTLPPEEPAPSATATIPGPALADEPVIMENTLPPGAASEGTNPADGNAKKPATAAITPATAEKSGEKPAPLKPDAAKARIKAADAAAGSDAAKSAGKGKGTDKATALAKAEEKGGKKKDDPKAADERAGTNGKYVVQVRATSDESEANLIAKKLRKKGISNVEVVRSEKNGAPFYKIRFVAAGTSSQAQEKAKSAGYADAWVVRQK